MDIRKKLTDLKAPTSIRKAAGQLQPLPRTMDALIQSFLDAADPMEVEFNVLWGLIYLNIQVENPVRSCLYLLILMWL